MNIQRPDDDRCSGDFEKKTTSPQPVPNVAEIMQKVRLELARRRDVETQAVIREDLSDVSNAPSSEAFDDVWHPVAARLPDQGQYALGDFLRFDDADFVEVVYRKLLKRPANDEGSHEYLRALRGGLASKVDILGMVRFSGEGSRHAVPVAGLSRRYRLRRWRRIPIVGQALGMVMLLVRLPRLTKRLQDIEAAAAHESQEIGRLLNRTEAAMRRRLSSLDSTIVALRLENDAYQEKTTGQLDAHGAALAAHEGLLATHGAVLGEHVATLAKRGAVLDEHDRTFATHGAELAQHGAALARMDDRARDDQRSLRAMLGRLTVFLDVAARRQKEEIADDETAKPSALEVQYAPFEDAFRGERGEIKQRVAHYLETLAAAGINPGDDGIVLDLGSGRGEWLEVLSEHGYHGLGVDLNRGMLQASESRGHEVVNADVLDYLRAQDADTFAAITSMHLVEHIPHPVLLELLDEALRILRPGGALILETPNPENVLVGACRFYMDPTHLNPIPPLLLQWVVKARGFEDAVIERLSEHRGQPELQPVPDEQPGAQQINQMVAWFTAAPDYAVIARKPATS